MRGDLLKVCVAVLVGFLLFGGVLSGEALPAEASVLPKYGADSNPTGNPIGGGAGYSEIITSGDYTCANKTEFLAALATATSGDVIYIPSTASINLTGRYDVNVPAGITIASNRGSGGSTGGRIFTSSMTAHYRYLLKVGNYVTFNGLRLEGPDGTVGFTGADPTITGIYCSGKKGLVVENCEIYNWPFAGVGVYDDGVNGINNGGRFYVHHNYFHHNQRGGYGYGVDTAASSGLIEANSFDYGRHFIAGGRGFPVNYIESRFNIFGSHCTNALYDQHGGNDDPSWGFDEGPDPAVPAGGILLIHHNTFQSATKPSVGIRGVPYVTCDVYNNWTLWPQSESTTCFKQRLENLGLTPYQNMRVYDNWYGTTPETSFTTAAQLQADFSVSSVGSSEGLMVVFFANMSSGGVSPLTYAWDFENDGIIDSTEWQPWHCYRESGTYTVSLTVIDATRDADTEVGWNCLTILSSGGATVETADRQVTTQFPSGAVPGAAMVSIGRTSASSLPDMPGGFTMGDTCYEILALDDSGSEIATLSQPATITVKYSEADVAAAGGDPKNLVLAYWDEAAGRWEILKTTVDTANMTLSASTTHLSTWAVLATTPASNGLRPWLWAVIGVVAALTAGTAAYVTSKRLATQRK